MADLGFADEESNFDNESVAGAPQSIAGDRAPKRSLTELDDEADQNDQEQEQETPAGSDDNDKEEDDDDEVSCC